MTQIITPDLVTIPLATKDIENVGLAMYPEDMGAKTRKVIWLPHAGEENYASQYIVQRPTAKTVDDLYLEKPSKADQKENYIKIRDHSYAAFNEVEVEETLDFYKIKARSPMAGALFYIGTKPMFVLEFGIANGTYGVFIVQVAEKLRSGGAKMAAFTMSGLRIMLLFKEIDDPSKVMLEEIVITVSRPNSGAVACRPCKQAHDKIYNTVGTIELPMRVDAFSRRMKRFKKAFQSKGTKTAKATVASREYKGAYQLLTEAIQKAKNAKADAYPPVLERSTLEMHLKDIAGARERFTKVKDDLYVYSKDEYARIKNDANLLKQRAREFEGAIKASLSALKTGVTKITGDVAPSLSPVDVSMGKLSEKEKELADKLSSDTKIKGDVAPPLSPVDVSMGKLSEKEKAIVDKVSSVSARQIRSQEDVLDVDDWVENN